MHRNAFGQLVPLYARSFALADEGGGGGGDEFTPITTQEAFDTAIAARINREKAKYSQFDGVDLADLQAKATELQTLKSSQGATESELNGKITAAETRATTAETRATTAESGLAEAQAKLTRYEVAAEVGIPLTHAPRLIGSTKEELEKDAKEYKKSLRSSGFDPGQGRTDGGAAEGAEGIAEAEKRFGKSNQ